MMRKLKRWLQTRREAEIAPRLKGVLQMLGESIPELHGAVPVKTGHRGHDSTFYLDVGGKRLAVLRLNNPYITRPSPTPDMPFVLLPPAERVAREFAMYAMGCKLKLTPEPVWHTHDALVCRYVPMAPLPAVPNWRVLRGVNLAISALHSMGASHMDVSPNNVLADDAQEYFVFVDFEYAPAADVNVITQRAYDYLRLLESCWKFMPESMRGEYALWLTDVADRFGHDAKQVQLSRLAPALKRILAEPGLGDAIRRVFPN